MGKRFSAGMRMALGVLALSTLTATSARAQAAPSTTNEPANAAPPNAALSPKPSADGTYEMGFGITSPKIVQATPAVYPDEPPPDSSCYFKLTIGADGVPYNVRGLTPSCRGAYEAAALEGVEKSKFEAGLLGQKQVPVAIELRVHFTADRSPAIPQIMHNSNRQYTPPSVLHSVDPSYSKEARRKKIAGIVVVSTLINEEGLPTDVRVEKSLGYGLDEEAVKSVSQYRFKPAQKDGKPVAYRVNIEVDFQIY